MSKLEHTPGPWQVDRESEDYFAVNHDPGRRWKHVALVRANNDGTAPITADEAEANAFLIAAAPDLLEACEAMLALVGPHDTGLAEAAEKMRAAVAKAKGEGSG